MILWQYWTGRKQSYLLNDYYQTNLDDYTKGTLRFPLRNLEAGIHTITFKAWGL
jgi:hypothetical protein